MTFRSRKNASVAGDPTWRSRHRKVWTVVATLCVTGSLLVVGSVPAAATEYPTWGDVEAARASEGAKAAEIVRIRGLIADLDAQAIAAQALAQQRAAEFESAQIASDDASIAAELLETQVTAAAIKADESRRQAGQLAASLARGGGDTATLQLIFSGDAADDVLGGLGTAAKLSEAANVIYETATVDRNAAQVLRDQAAVAAAERERLAADADTALQAASDAAATAAAAVAEQQVNQATLQAQLAVLVEDRVASEADFAAGERERARLRAEAAAQAAAAAAAAANSGSGAGGTAPDAGQLSGQGWIKPVAGRITSGFGPRPTRPVPGVNPYHYAADIGAGCDTTVRAATGGTVVYSGWFGSYGNWVLLDHGDGVQTGYAHNRNGGLLVSVGQSVAAGDPIALVGSTGASSGCHSHFEVRTDGSRTDPVPFMRDRGAALG